MGGPALYIAIHKEIFVFTFSFNLNLSSKDIEVATEHVRRYITVCKKWMKCHMRYEVQANMIFTDSSSSSSSSP